MIEDKKELNKWEKAVEYNINVILKRLDGYVSRIQALEKQQPKVVKTHEHISKLGGDRLCVVCNGKSMGQYNYDNTTFFCRDCGRYYCDRCITGECTGKTIPANGG